MSRQQSQLQQQYELGGGGYEEGVVLVCATSLFLLFICHSHYYFIHSYRWITDLIGSLASVHCRSVGTFFDDVVAAGASQSVSTHSRPFVAVVAAL